MDSQFSFFGIRFGLENIIGLFPGGGDVLTLALSGYLLIVGVQMGLPRFQLMKMIRNLVIDVVIGFLPIVGDVSDIFFKANMRNLRILEEFEAQKDEYTH